jgi:hypothetical protein
MAAWRAQGEALSGGLAGDLFRLASASIDPRFLAAGSAAPRAAGHVSTATERPARGGLNAPSGPERLPASSAGSAGVAGGGGAAGVAFGIFLALLVSLAALAVPYWSRLRSPSAAWSPTAFVAVTERPG